MEKLMVKRPNLKTHIALYYSNYIDSSILNSDCIKELLMFSGSFDFAMNFTYAIYADHSMVKDNMMIPIFHSYYLNSDPKMVVLMDNNALDILELYPYHNFYIYQNAETYQLFKTKFPNHRIQLINSIKELI